MVTSQHPIAAEAGIEMLKLGGNGVDAAVATAWTVGVVEPWQSGIGGGGSMVIHHDGEDMAIDFGTVAPRSARPDMYMIEGDSDARTIWGWPLVRNQENELGHRSVGTPGVVAGLCLAHERFGKLPLSVVMEPAIHAARDGFDVDWFTTLMIAIRLPEPATIFLKDGTTPPRPMALGESAPDRIVQADLAGTLEQIAKYGPDTFYKGDVAAAISRDMAANGGVLSKEDLAGYSPRVYPGGLRGSYRDCEIVGVPGATGGSMLQEILNILDGYDMRTLGYNTVDSLHLIAEACWRSIADSLEHFGDSQPDSALLRCLLSKEYSDAVRTTIGDRATVNLESVDPTLFPMSSHTSHLCAVDRDHNGVTLSQTLFHYFGSTVVPSGTGILLNDMMVLFDPRPGQPNSISGGKWLPTPFAPTVVLRDGRLQFVVGSPGGRRVPTALAQVIVNIVDHDMNMMEAISAPRLHAESADVTIDDRIDQDVLDGLARLGHRVTVAEAGIDAPTFGSPNGILVTKDEMLSGGTDPMKPAAVAIGIPV
jgi:gamma-glutamyltranspeptidase/glutathione hydrolase